MRVPLDPATRPSRLPALTHITVVLLLSLSFISGLGVWCGEILQARSLETPAWLHSSLIYGVRYGHILNPRTGYPIQGVAACTVIAPTCMESDAMATACLVYGVEKSLAKFGGRYPMRFTLMPTNSLDQIWPLRQTITFGAER